MKLTRIILCLSLIVSLTSCDYVKEYQDAQKWQVRAYEMYKEGIGDCSDRVSRLIVEMKEAGLRAGYDYVAERCFKNGRKHIRLNLYRRFIVDPACPPGMYHTYKVYYRGKYR